MSKLSEFAQLLKEQKRHTKEEVAEAVPENSVVEIPKDSLKSLFTEIAQVKKQHKEELKEKSVVVLPKLDEFFSLLSKQHTQASEVEEAVSEIPVQEDSEVQQVVETVQQIADEIKNVTADAIAAKDEIEEVSQDPEIQQKLDDLKESVVSLEKRLNKEVEALKKLINTSAKQITVNSGGGGEVKFRKLDDVSIQAVQDGDVIIYDSITKTFKNASLQDMITQPAYTKLIDDTEPGVMYLGEASPGSSQSDPVWRVQKIIFDSAGSVDAVLYAALGAFTQVWLNRTSLIYG